MAIFEMNGKTGFVHIPKRSGNLEETKELTEKQKKYKHKYGEETFNDAMEVMDILNSISKGVYRKMYPDTSNEYHRKVWLDGHNAGIAFGISMMAEAPKGDIVKKILAIIKKERGHKQ